MMKVTLKFKSDDGNEGRAVVKRHTDDPAEESDILGSAILDFLTATQGRVWALRIMADAVSGSLPSGPEYLQKAYAALCDGAHAYGEACDRYGKECYNKLTNEDESEE